MHGLLHDPVFLLEWLALSAVAGIALWVVSCDRRPWQQHRLCLGGLLLCACFTPRAANAQPFPERQRARISPRPRT